MVVLLYIYLTIHYSAGSNHQTIHLSKTKPNIYKSISSTKEEHLQAAPLPSRPINTKRHAIIIEGLHRLRFINYSMTSSEFENIMTIT